MLSALAHIFTPRPSNNHRPRLLHPAGLAILIAIFLTTNSALELAKAYPPQGFVLGFASNITVDQVLTLINLERTNAGLQPLAFNQKLSQAAAGKANDMFGKDYWAHTSPDGLTPWVFIKDTGYRYSVAGENLARDFNDTPTMVAAWMNSPTHKTNIVHPKYKESGIAVVNGRLDGIETTLVVQMFSTPSSGAITTKSTTTSQIASGQTNNHLPTNESSTLALGQELSTSDVPSLTSTIVSQAGASGENPVYVSPTKVKQSLGLVIVLLLIAILVLDEFIVRKKKTMRFVGKNLAHLSFLALVLAIIIGLSQRGGIL